MDPSYSETVDSSAAASVTDFAGAARVRISSARFTPKWTSAFANTSSDADLSGVIRGMDRDKPLVRCRVYCVVGSTMETIQVVLDSNYCAPQNLLRSEGN